jgi:hypothetical protein
MNLKFKNHSFQEFFNENCVSSPRFLVDKLDEVLKSSYEEDKKEFFSALNKAFNKNIIKYENSLKREIKKYRDLSNSLTDNLLD